MIDALILGRLYGKPQQRTGKTGQPYVTAKLRAADDAAAMYTLLTDNVRSDAA